MVPAAQLRVFVPSDTLLGRDVGRWTMRLGRSSASERERDVAGEERLLVHLAQAGPREDDLDDDGPPDGGGER